MYITFKPLISCYIKFCVHAFRHLFCSISSLLIDISTFLSNYISIYLSDYLSIYIIFISIYQYIYLCQYLFTLQPFFLIE